MYELSSPVVSGKFTSHTRSDATNILTFPSVFSIMRTNEIYLHSLLKYLPIRARGSDLDSMEVRFVATAPRGFLSPLVVTTSQLKCD